MLKNILRLLVGCRLCSLADTAGCSRRAQPLAYVVVFWPLLSGPVDSAGSRHTTLVKETNQRQRRATINRHCNNIAHAATAMMVQIVGNRNPSLFTSYLAEKLTNTQPALVHMTLRDSNSFHSPRVMPSALLISLQDDV